MILVPNLRSGQNDVEFIVTCKSILGIETTYTSIKEVKGIKSQILKEKQLIPPNHLLQSDEEKVIYMTVFLLRKEAGSHEKESSYLFFRIGSQ